MLVSKVKVSEIEILRRVHAKILVLVTGTWSSKHHELIKDLADNLKHIYCLESSGNDEEEDYIINELLVRKLPAVVAFSSDRVDFIEYERFQSIRDHIGTYQTLLPRMPTEIESLITQFTNKDCDLIVGRIFVAGDKSSVGKSTSCLGIIGSMIRQGFNPSDLAYIKPITQCEAEQSVTRYCMRVGVECIGVGPVVFYKGFTRAYLKGETESSAVLLDKVKEAVRKVSVGKKFVIIDGVGYPAVGSICGVSNADVAKALDAPVLLIGKSGVGDAVDSYNLNAVFFESRNVRVLGCVFNKLPREGFYNLEACREAVTKYFDQFRPVDRVYGFIPVLKVTEKHQNDMLTTATEIGTSLSDAKEDVDALVESFTFNVDTRALLWDVWSHSLKARAEPWASMSTTVKASAASRERSGILSPCSSPLESKIFTHAPVVIPPPPPRQLHTSLIPSRKRTREDIEWEAVTQGASGS